MKTDETSRQLDENGSAAPYAGGRKRTAGLKRADSHVRYTFDTLDLYQEAPLILGYLPQKTEIDSIPIMREALRAGKRLALPWIDPKTDQITFYEVTYVSTKQTAGHGLDNPPVEGKPIDHTELPNSLCLVPNVQFDGTSFRWASAMDAYEGFLNNYTGWTVALVGGQISDEEKTATCDLPLDIVVGETDIVMVGVS